MFILFFNLYFVICFVWPSFKIYKATKINPITFKIGDDSAHGLIGFYMKFIMICILGSCIEPHLPDHFQLSMIFKSEAIHYLGYAVVLFSVIWTYIAQDHMSSSWRIGIDEINKTELKVEGVFKFSRNPIFLGMLFSVLGFFLSRPTSLNLALLVISYILISIQTRLEEAFLLSQHGIIYQQYKDKTKRWL